MHAGLLAWVDLRNAPVSDEASHLAAGVLVWHFGHFDLYPVNPPLVRTVAALPVVCLRPEGAWDEYGERRVDALPESRPEWSVGIGFVRKNVENAMWHFGWARWACIPLSLIGGYFCWRWAGELYGDWAGAMAVVMWCAYWGHVPPEGNLLFNLKAANPVYFLVAAALVCLGAYKRWLNNRELLLAAGLLLIPYCLQGARVSMAGHARYSAVVFPVYIVLGHLLHRAPPALAGALLAVSGLFLAIYSAMFVSWYWFY